jgi:hypothetical protein
MRLSEAIRLGAMLAPQATGALFSKDGGCALGAALLAVGVTSEGSARVTALALWQWAIVECATCPLSQTSS